MAVRTPQHEAAGWSVDRHWMGDTVMKALQKAFGRCKISLFERRFARVRDEAFHRPQLGLVLRLGLAFGRDWLPSVYLAAPVRTFLSARA
jgi:hypothetical protein